MFNPGDEVICIDDTPVGDEAPLTPLKKGERYVVRAFYPQGSLFTPGLICLDAGVSVGLSWPAIEEYALANGITLPHSDLWAARRFRKVLRITEAKQEILSLCVPTKARERVSA